MESPDYILVVCPKCRARVQAKTVGNVFGLYHAPGKPKEITSGTKITLSQCSACGTAMTVIQKLTEYREKRGRPAISIWGDADRVWPETQSILSKDIPASIRTSLLEAVKCLDHGTYTASVAMTGRALEAIARHFHKDGKEKRVMLGRGLEELHANKIIDERLYTWSKELQEQRNLAAHATDTHFTKPDAEDLFDFAVAICEYVFVISKKYDAFLERKEARKEAQKLLVETPALETGIA